MKKEEIKKEERSRYFYNFMTSELIYVDPQNHAICTMKEIHSLGELPDIFNNLD